MGGRRARRDDAAWTAAGGERALSALLVVAAAAGLLPARLRRELDPLLGPPVGIPLIAGVVAGIGASGALAALGTAGVTAAGYAGVLLATTVPELLSGGWRMLRATAVATGSVMAIATLVHLAAGAHAGALALLLLLTAAPTLLVAWRRPGDRWAAAPIALGCLAAAAMVAAAGGLLSAGTAAVLLASLYGLGLLVATTLADDARRPTVVTAGVTAVAALAVGALARDRGALAVLLLVQGAATAGWALWSDRRTAGRTAAQPPGEEPAPSGGWRLAALQVTLGLELMVYGSGARVLEAFTLPVAAGLLLASGPGLVRGASWPAWGPGLLVAAVPSGALAVLAPGATRPVVVLVVAAATMVVAAVSGVRAPLVIGAGTAVGVALGLAVAALLWPVAGVLLVGAGLLVVGARGEEFPVAFLGVRLADLR